MPQQLFAKEHLQITIKLLEQNTALTNLREKSFKSHRDTDSISLEIKLSLRKGKKKSSESNVLKDLFSLTYSKIRGKLKTIC